ncbi:MAG: hypothetical protein QOJ69_379 [Actinomycetota bacterium]|nr:hypothetical protein [Actinomycetota bacterium]
MAVGVAVSPLPIVALILMLLTPKARSTGTAFALGWVIGLAAVVIVAVALGGTLTPSDGGGSGTLDTLKIVGGAALIFMGVRRWRRHAATGADHEEPKWMADIDSTGPGKALVLGAALSGVNPKNLILGLAAGASIAQTEVAGSDRVVAIAAYVLLGSLTIVGVLAFFLALGRRAENALQGLRTWLVANSAAVMSVVFVVMGAVILGKGVAGR